MRIRHVVPHGMGFLPLKPLDAGLTGVANSTFQLAMQQAADGHEVECYEDSHAGVQAALSGGFDVLLVNLMMPGIDGLGILKRVKEAGVSSEVVIITGHSTVESAVAAMKEGAADYLSKPFERTELLEKLHKYLPSTAANRPRAEQAEATAVLGH